MGNNTSQQGFSIEACLGEKCRRRSGLRVAILNDDPQKIIEHSERLQITQTESNITLGQRKEPPFLLAVRRTCEKLLSVETLKIMIETGFNPNVFSLDDIKMTPLYTAASSSRADIVQLLLSAGANANTPTGRNLSPLFIASAAGSLECTRLLLKAGANPNSLTASLKGTALHMAGQSGHKDDLSICRLLLEYGCIISLKDSVGRTALNSACGSRRDLSHTVNFLLDHGADIDVQDNNGMTPLMRAARAKNDTVASLLIKRGANINLENNEGQTASDIKRKFGLNNGLI